MPLVFLPVTANFFHRTIYLSVCLPISLPTHLSFNIPTSRSPYLPTNLFPYLPPYQPTYVTASLSTYLFIASHFLLRLTSIHLAAGSWKLRPRGWRWAAHRWWIGCWQSPAAPWVGVERPQLCRPALSSRLYLHSRRVMTERGERESRISKGCYADHVSTWVGCETQIHKRPKCKTWTKSPILIFNYYLYVIIIIKNSSFRSNGKPFYVDPKRFCCNLKMNIACKAQYYTKIFIH